MNSHRPTLSPTSWDILPAQLVQDIFPSSAVRMLSLEEQTALESDFDTCFWCVLLRRGLFYLAASEIVGGLILFILLCVYYGLYDAAVTEEERATEAKAEAEELDEISREKLEKYANVLNFVSTFAGIFMAYVLLLIIFATIQLIGLTKRSTRLMMVYLVWRMCQLIIQFGVLVKYLTLDNSAAVTVIIMLFLYVCFVTLQCYVVNAVNRYRLMVIDQEKLSLTRRQRVSVEPQNDVYYLEVNRSVSPPPYP